MQSESVASRYLSLLAERGISHLFVNAGTDFAPLVEAYARSGDAQGPALPAPVLCTHENLAVGMAHGAYLVSGRPQAVMFHVSVGTANAVCAVTNAARDNVPLLVTAGRTPILEDGALGARDTHIHWAQEMFDQAGMLRELVKWDYELRDPRQVHQVVDRALSMATSHPRGPVYLSLPREVLAEQMPDADAGARRTAVPVAVEPESSAIEELAGRIAAARCPVIVTSASGCEPDSVAVLADLADRFAIGIAEMMPRYLNAPMDHELHLGTQMQSIFDAADLIVFLECDVPWIAARAAPRPETFIVQAGTDPLYSRYPMCTHRSDLTLAATPTALLTGLADALASRAGQVDPDRRARLVELARRGKAAIAKLKAAEAEREGTITRAGLSAVLGDALDDETVIFNEYWGVAELLGRRQPGTYFYLPPAGGLGWGLPAALGAKQAAPEKTVVAAVGDGAYLFANPAACHHAAAKHGLPVLTVIANNASWGAVDFATRAVYPDGSAVQSGERRLSDLSPAPAFEAYCEASGGFGERVTEPSALAPAVERALKAVRDEGRQALLNVACV